MELSGHDRADFSGFMANEAGANWMAIRACYNGGPDNILVGRERSCLFHWEQSLQKHTRNLVPKEKQKVHIEMCEVWRNSKSYEMASKQASTIRQWWSTGNVLTENMRRLELWFKWWEQRIVHWGSLHLSVSLIPSTYSTSTCKDVLLYIEFIVSLCAG